MTRLATLVVFAGRPALADAVPGDLGVRIADDHAYPAAQAFTAAARETARLADELRATPTRFGEQQR